MLVFNSFASRSPSTPVLPVLSFTKSLHLISPDYKNLFGGKSDFSKLILHFHNLVINSKDKNFIFAG
jgi:hypothetical protein